MGATAVSHTSKLSRHPDGYWVGASDQPIAYPEVGNEHCFGIEEGSFWFRHRNAVITSVVGALPPAGEIVDVGGGNGFVSLGLEASGFETVVVEPGPVGARNAVKRGLSRVICSTFEGAAFDPGTIPAIGSFDVLEHIGDDEGLLRLFAKAIVPHGRLYLTVPAFQILWSRDDEYAGHHRRYSRKALNQKLTRSGFRVLYATYFFFFLPPVIFASRTVPSWIGHRAAVTAALTEREHAKRAGVVGEAMDRLLELELRLIRARRFVPVGGSLLVVAERV